MTSLYKEIPDKSGKLYLFDLLGAVTGTLLLLLVTRLTGLSGYLPILAAALAALLFFDEKEKLKWVPLSAAILIFFMRGWIPVISVGESQLRNTNTPLGETLNYPRFKARWIKSLWDVYSRCDLLEASMDGTKKSVFINGGSEAQILYYDGKEKTAGKLKKDILYLPYREGKNDQILVLGAGGGRDVLMASLSGASRIDAVEINRGVIDLTNEQAAFSGDVYGLKGVNLHVTDARTYLMRSRRKYDRIVMNLSSTYAFSDIAALGQLENYLYTMEAFKLYFDHLTDNGVLTLYINYPQLAEKFLHTALEHFHKQGLPYHEASRRMIALAPSDWYYLLIFSKNAFKVDRVDRIKSLADQAGVRLLYLPYYWIDYSKSDLAQQIFTDFNLIANGRHSPSEYRRAAAINLEPVTDNQPYFLEVVHNHRHQLKTFLKILILILLSLTVIFMLFRKNDAGGKFPALFSLLYFIFIGIAFMMVELTLIKRFSFYFGYPQLTLSVVLVAVLAGAGLGGNFLTDFAVGSKVFLPAISFILAVVLVLSSGLIVNFIDQTIRQPIMLRSLLSVFLIMIPAVLMGVPFPAGLKTWGTDSNIPWYWGVNGVASVAGSVLAAVIALTYGFDANLDVAAVFYLLAGFCFWLIPRFMKNNA